ncbi:MAG: hypothetical protein CL927_07575 [Deltaproteobacteria bacterium]|nr:hypothetical protein [Deltaproteobacteria bacterium]HCH66446.1 hypothetical protein [Deltaproteobacteria bacterium]
MLSLALPFELRSLLRNRVGITAVLAYIVIGSVAIAMGARHVSAWEHALDEAKQAQEASVAEASGYFESGKPGPEDRSWVDLSKPRWQNEYAATRVVRDPGPLAGIAAGSIDPAPVAFQLRSRADPLAVAGYRIENPEVASGSVDLVFVLTMLTPLLIGVLGLEIGGRDREERIDRLVIVQAGEVRGWLVARVVAVTTIASTAVATVCLAAALVGGAGFSASATLLGMALGYTILWGGLLLVVAAGAPTVRVGAFGFGALWTVLCVLLPATVAEIGVGRTAADFAIGETLDARAQQWSAYDQDAEVRVQALYARFPELQELPAGLEEMLAPGLSRHTYKASQLERLEARHSARLQQEADARQFATRASWLSPPIALTVALERVAGVGPEAASAYRSHVVEAFTDRLHWIVVQAWTLEPLDQGTFEDLVAEGPAPFRWRPIGLASPAAALLVWLLAGWLFAMFRLVRTERRFGMGAETSRDRSS